MKKVGVMLLIIAAVVFSGCRPVVKPGPPPVKIVAIGDSITMGTQDAGLKEDFQKHNYPYLIAKQMGTALSYKQPYLNPEKDGIGTPPYKKPLTLSGGIISATYWETGDDMVEYIKDQLTFFIYLQRPYDNLGINGARLFDLRNTTDSTNSQSDGNYFFDLVLRNALGELLKVDFPQFGTIVEQATLLNPDYILLWIGNNDILHIVLNGCGLNGDGFTNDQPTTPEDFGNEYAEVLQALAGISDGILIATIPDYLPFVYALDEIADDEGNLCIFDPQTFLPYDFGEGLFIPLILEETGSSHLLLSGAIMYMDLEGQGYGQGIPIYSEAQAIGYTGDEDQYTSALSSLGLTPPPISTPLPGNFTLTDNEVTQAKEDYIDEYNDKIDALISLNPDYNCTLINISESWWRDGDFDDYSMDYALQDQEKTAFSLDGVHPNDLGQALCAHAFIEVLNDEYMLGIPQIDPALYAGQYSGKSIEARGLKALQKLEEF